MKKLKKINIGLVLTIITIAIVVIYSVSVEMQRKGSKEDIRRSCEEYISLVDKYSVLPENAQVLGGEAKNINLDSFKSEMEKDLKSVMVSDSAAELQKMILSDYVEKDLINTSQYTTSYDRKIVKIKSYEFDGNQVTVTFKASVRIKQKYMELNNQTGAPEEKVKEQNVDTESNIITLEKKDNKWKVVYSNFDTGFDNMN